MPFRLPALGAALVLAATAVASAAPTVAGAIDQDLVVSAITGPPGTEITVSSASCASTDDIEAYLDASLIVGTAPAEQLAAVGSNLDGTAKLVVPDWVDPDQPAVIEARCSTYDVTTDVADGLDYDPVAFDLEPGSGTPVQVRSLSRTALLAGQGFTVTGSCGDLGGSTEVSVVVAEGTDQAGRDLIYPAAQRWGETEADGSFELPVIVSNATVYIGSDGADTTIDELGTSEEPLQLEPGAYTVFTACHVPRTPSSVLLEPSPFEITGAAPTGDVDLISASPGSQDVVMTGACDEAVAGSLTGLSLADLVAQFQEPDQSRAGALGRSALLVQHGGTGDRIEVRDGRSPGRGADRMVASDQATDFAASPDASGRWRHQEPVAFAQGVVIGQGTCGDPFADGFAYDPQGVVVDASEIPTTTVPPLVAPTVPAPPASAVPGTPTYAG